MPLESITPQYARQLIGQGALLVDICAPDEHAREHIACARHVPLEQLAGKADSLGDSSPVIFHCRSGMRTQSNAQDLCACVRGQAYVLQGGLEAWKKAGLPVVTKASQPMEIQRQVQIAVGALVVLGTLLGFMASPWFHILSGVVGAGLVVAGVSGFCGMAHALMLMPWNRKKTAA